MKHLGDMTKTMEYIRPKSLKEVLQTLKSAKGKAKLIAGGTNVTPDIREKVLRSNRSMPSLIIAI